MSDLESKAERKPWPDYRTVWRWHFYAGLVCIPFLIVLSISGATYLFKNEIESWIDRDYDHLTLTSEAKSPSERINAAVQAITEGQFKSYELPQAADSATRVIVDGPDGAVRVYVHPGTLAILKTVPEESRLFRRIFKLHGELWIGNSGSAIVEVAASWAIIMVVTGLFLWWPRKVSGLGGVLYPRLIQSSRIFWRDIHSVSGLWLSAFILFLIVTGLPWAKFWGDYLKKVRALTGTAVARQDWSNGAGQGSVVSQSNGGGGGHGDHAGGKPRVKSSAPVDLTAVDRIDPVVGKLGLEAPVLIAPPAGKAAKTWSAKSMTGNRTKRVDLECDPATGEVVGRKGFAEKHWIDKAVSTGVAAHEGRLFGWPNQLLGLITAFGLVLLCLSSIVMWWKRRESGVLGAPKVLVSPRFSRSFLAILAAFGLYLPLFGVSLVLVVILEYVVLRRIPKVRDWLGLRGPVVIA